MSTLLQGLEEYPPPKKKKKEKKKGRVIKSSSNSLYRNNSMTKRITRIIKSRKKATIFDTSRDKLVKSVGWLIRFYHIPIVVSYLMPNPVHIYVCIYIYIVIH